MRVSRVVKQRIRAQESAQTRAQAKSQSKAQSKAQAGARRKAETAAKAASDDLPPQDMVAFRNELARRLHVIIGNQQGYWRHCPQRCCRRARACRVPTMQCSGAPPMPETTPEQVARVKAELRAALMAAAPATDRRGAREP